MDLLPRLHQRLLLALERAPEGPLTIGELYQQLIPYRTVRTELGVWELAQYEHALLRLLAGEGGYMEISDAAALDELRRELQSPNPILGIYRDFAGVMVHLPGRAPAAPPPPSPHPPAAAPPPAPLPPAPAVLRCRPCGAPLPDAADLRFCPACGVDQTEQPCGGCGSPLRAEWNFCIRCGAARDGSVPARRGR